MGMNQWEWVEAVAGALALAAFWASLWLMAGGFQG